MPLGPYELKNGSAYIGHWLKGEKGRKRKINVHSSFILKGSRWTDGSIYEGYWRNN